MPQVPSNTYTIPFNPIGNSEGGYCTAEEQYNHHCFVYKRGSRVTPYPEFAQVYTGSERCIIKADAFNDLYLMDFVDANKRLAE